MPVILENSEIKLLEHLQALESDRRLWHLAILNGSKMTVPNQRLLMLSEAHLTLMSLAWEAGVAIYCCMDRDIAMLFQGQRSEYWPTLRGVLQELLPHMKPEDIDYSSLFTIFELEHHYPQATAWLQQKLQNLDNGYCALELVDGPINEESWNQQRFSSAIMERNKRQRKMIAVIEDNRAQRQLAYSILRTEYDVLMATNGLEALELYNNWAPDMLFLDINLPQLDGIKVLEKIIRIDPNARIVMFSSQSSAPVLKGAMDIGAKGFVSKPFTADALMRYARATLDQPQF